jgi:sugar/nucleoside kinase (ribokinase family)
MAEGQVLCTGAAIVDLMVARPERLPEAGTSLLVDHIGLAPGGCGLNTALGLARLEVPTAFWARLGADPAGDFVGAALAAAGVDLTHCRQEAQVATKCAVVLVGEDGERAFLRVRGGGNAIGPEDAAVFDWRGIAHLHIGGCYSLRRLLGTDLAAALARARTAGVVTSVDTVWSTEGAWKMLLPALPETDHLLPSLDEGRALSGLEAPEAIVDWLHAQGARTVVLKLGAEGALASDGCTRLRVAACPVPGGRVVDTTGAGDAFCAGYIAALRAGKPLAEAVRWGNACGAAAVTARGATGGLVDRAGLATILAAC